MPVKLVQSAYYAQIIPKLSPKEILDYVRVGN